MARRYVAFDIESATEWPDGGDWKPHRPLGISCAATLAAGSKTPRLWHGVGDDGRPAGRMSREEAAELAGYLLSMVERGYSILTWNGLVFDFDVLAEESGMLEECRGMALGHVDMMFHVFCELGHFVALDAAAKAVGLAGKPKGMRGIMAPGMWAAGKHQEILDYAAQDSHTTLELATLCEERRSFRWITRRGDVRRMDLRRGWLDVKSAIKLPEPDTSWMSNPVPRSRFTEWLGK